MASHRFTIHGVRGSSPASGAAFAQYGGETTCFSLSTPDALLVIDAGTGICRLDRELSAIPNLPPITMLFTHFHLDHLIGLPFFRPIYRRSAAIRILRDPAHAAQWPNALGTLIAPPYWPLELGQAGARISSAVLPSASRETDVAGVRLSWCPVWHPQGCLAFKIAVAGFTLVIATDREPGNADMDRAFLDFCQDADALIYDAQYTPAELERHRGWGHGSWQDAVAIARAAGVGELILTHHDRSRTDADIAQMAAEAAQHFRSVRPAYSGLTLEW